MTVIANDLQSQLEAVIETVAQAIEAAPTGMLAIDGSGTIILANSQTERLFGYSSAEMLGQSIEMLVPERYRSKHTAERARFHDAPRTRPMGDGPELFGRRRDGSEFPVEIGLNPFGKAGGDFVLASVMDITARRAHEIEATRATAVLDTVLDGILVIDRRGMVSTFSPGAERIFGYSAPEVLGQNVNMLMPHPHRKAHDGYLDRYLATGNAQIIGVGREVEGVRKNGTRVPLELQVTEMQLGGETFFTGVVRDITERQEARAALAAQNRELEATARLDRVAAKVVLALAAAGSEKPVERVLSELQAEGGYRPIALYEYDEWQGDLTLRRALGLGPSAPTSYRLGEGLVGESARTRRPVFLSASSTPFRLDTGVGLVETAHVFAVPLLHQDALLGVLVGASTNPLTERERNWLGQIGAQVAVGLSSLRQYEQLRKLSEQLNARTRRIDQQNQELARANRLKSEFLANMSHELRTPLNAVIGFSEVLKDGVMGELTGEQLDYVSEIFHSGRHLLSLINDILDLSKIEAGKMTLHVEEVSVEQLVDNALTIMKEPAHKGGVSLSSGIHPGCRVIEADGRKLRQIVYNLLSNAVKFTAPGGTVRVEVEPREGGDEIEFAVVDTGIGIAAEDLAGLFEPFQQLDGGIDRKFEGTGLGLAMVERLAELHGGAAGVESQLGEGSRFWVRLPRLRREGQTSVLPSPTVAVVDQEARDEPVDVLIVEDDPPSAEILRKWLTRAGYQCRHAPDPAVAERMIDQRAPDVLLLDLLFSNGAEGYAFLERVRQDRALGSIPVVIVSIVADTARGLSLGAQAVLQKPVRPDDLLHTLRQIVGRPGGGLDGVRILVVDDDPRAVEHVAQRLESEGSSVTRAFGGRAALETLHSEPFDAVVLDLMMPDVSGLEVLHEMNDTPALAQTPVIVLTAKLLEPAERDQLEQTVSTVLLKGDWDEAAFLRAVRGATHLPRRKMPSAAPPRSDEIAVGSAHILVIDDDRNARDLLRLYLEDAGHRVTTAVGVDDASATLEGGRPDLITLDLNMPGKDGFAFLRAVGETESLAGVPIVVVSGADHPNRALAMGAGAVLAKPVRRHDLVEAVSRVVGRPEGRPPYVLVVDDDPQAIKIVSSYFATADYEVGMAFGGHEALERVALRCPDVVILDLMMPGLSGIDVLRALRSDPATEHLPVVVLTAKQLTGAERRDLEVSAQGLFTKANVVGTEILEHIEGVLARAQIAAGRSDQ